MEYKNIGLNRRMQRVDSLPDRDNYIQAIDFESNFEVQSSKLNASKLNLGEFIKRAGAGTALGTFNLSTALNITSTITYNSPKAKYKTFGVPVVGIYQGAGTASANQIYPTRGTGVTLGRYEVVGGVVDYATYDGTSIGWSAMIIDTNGTSSQSVTFAADWLFTDYVTDNVG